jgi:hypothetical protein
MRIPNPDFTGQDYDVEEGKNKHIYFMKRVKNRVPESYNFCTDTYRSITYLDLLISLGGFQGASKIRPFS